MTTKEYLGQIRRLSCRIDNKLSELYQFRTLSTSITIATGSEHIVSSPSNDKMDKTIVKIMEMEEDINKLINVLIEKKNVIVAQIDSLDDASEYEVLYLRYVSNMTFEEIAENMAYSTRQVIRIYNNALKNFENKFGLEYMS